MRLCGPFVNAAVARHIKSVQSAEAREEADLWAAMNGDASPHSVRHTHAYNAHTHNTIRRYTGKLDTPQLYRT